LNDISLDDAGEVLFEQLSELLKPSSGSELLQGTFGNHQDGTMGGKAEDVQNGVIVRRYQVLLDFLRCHHMHVGRA
jgi:hypothetical protein